jgi:hypothetical protein
MLSVLVKILNFLHQFGPNMTIDSSLPHSKIWSKQIFDLQTYRAVDAFWLVI